ncbi:hypothetical protein D3273_24405 [Lichenibacterium minor]|uniref:Uncharacterized protein n=1 Tax=Lichenibacterium minor TaxID=2316528 RepID=A0A4Q2U100_9HYPH|nr:hypothetical protein [Lichenibacterium minor]RYC29338.1 hypothetical protein D3273_24405 [Lichenibacterium minor]
MNTTPRLTSELYSISREKLHRLANSLLDHNRVLMGGGIASVVRDAEKWSNYLSDKDAIDLLPSTISFSKSIDKLLVILDKLEKTDYASENFSENICTEIYNLIISTISLSKHLEVTETASVIIRQEGTSKANQAIRAKGDRRIDIARPFILGAALKANGKPKNLNSLLTKVNDALLIIKDENGVSIHPPIGLRQLYRWLEMVRANPT